MSAVCCRKDGKTEAYVVGVSGFLGLGANDVALSPSAFRVVAADEDQRNSRHDAGLDKPPGYGLGKISLERSGPVAWTVSFRPLSSPGMPSIHDPNHAAVPGGFISR